MAARRTPHAARVRGLVSRLVEAGIDLLDALDAEIDDLEDADAEQYMVDDL